jgi:hypothetical protein
MISWHDLRIWLSGFLGALAVAAFAAATLMRAGERARQDEDHAIPRRPAVQADVSDQGKIHRG